MVKTNIFATEQELKELKEDAHNAAQTPVIALSLGDGLAGRDFASMARDSLLRKCHRIALSHDLPEIDGYYGCDLQTGEFVKE